MHGSDFTVLNHRMEQLDGIGPTEPQPYIPNGLLVNQMPITSHQQGKILFHLDGDINGVSYKQGYFLRHFFSFFNHFFTNIFAIFSKNWSKIHV